MLIIFGNGLQLFARSEGACPPQSLKSRQRKEPSGRRLGLATELVPTIIKAGLKQVDGFVIWAAPVPAGIWKVDSNQLSMGPFWLRPAPLTPARFCSHLRKRCVHELTAAEHLAV